MLASVVDLNKNTMNGPISGSVAVFELKLQSGPGSDATYLSEPETMQFQQLCDLCRRKQVQLSLAAICAV